MAGVWMDGKVTVQLICKECGSLANVVDRSPIVVECDSCKARFYPDDLEEYAIQWSEKVAT